MKVNEIILESAIHARPVNELAPDAGGGGSGNYFQALASAWYNHDISMLADIARKGGSPMKKIMDAQEAVEKMLQRGVIGSDGKTRKYDITYNSDFDGVVIQSADYYEYSDYDAAGNEVDSRTGRPWGPNDYMEFDGDELDEGIYESTELTEEFDLIESIINRLAEHNGVDAEVIWEDLETLTEDELYAFAVTSEPIMESQGMAEGGREMTGTARDRFISAMTPRMDNDALMQKVAKVVNSPEFNEDTILKIVGAGSSITNPVGRYIQKEFNELQYDLGRQYEDYPERVAERLLSMLIARTKQGVTEAFGLYGPFTVTINTGERPQSRTKTKKFRREDDAILYAEDWLEDAPQYVFATAKVTDPEGNVVWTTDEQGVAEGEHPKTWHDVDPKLGKQVDKMSQAEKVSKGFAHSDTLKKKTSFIQKLDAKLQQLGYTPTQEGNVYRWTSPTRQFVEVEPNTEDPGWYGWAEGQVTRSGKLNYGDSGNDSAKDIVAIFKSGGVFRKQGVAEDWQKANKRDRTAGMSQKAVNAYRRENPGSKLKTAVTTKPSKLKRGSKASKRRKSYCSRSRGQMKMHSISCSKTPDKAICKARRRWNC